MADQYSTSTLGRNNLYGLIPESLSALSYLKHMYDTLTLWLCQSAPLASTDPRFAIGRDLSFNQLKGTIPANLANIKVLLQVYGDSHCVMHHVMMCGTDT
jgi:hypothetical protein